MSRLNLFLILILTGLLIFARADSAMEEGSITHAEPTVIPTSTSTPTPTIPPPSVLFIPKIQVSAPIHPVGTDQNGKMELPQDINVVGWYSLGYKPGEPGNAVISGHLDAATGEGAIFYNLKLIEPGDEIITLDQSGKEYKFRVIDKVTYPYDQVPIDSIFGKSTNKRLNLITCTGVWNFNQQNYSHRMVIYSEMEE